MENSQNSEYGVEKLSYDVLVEKKDVAAMPSFLFEGKLERSGSLFELFCSFCACSYLMRLLNHVPSPSRRRARAGPILFPPPFFFEFLWVDGFA